MKPLVLACLVLLLGNCAAIRPATSSRQVEHVVLVWLKRPGHAADRAKLLAAADSLRPIPGIRSLRAGVPLASDRPVVDDSFDVGFVMQFDSIESLRTYGSHPVHVAAQRQLQELSKRVLVYDITPEPPDTAAAASPRW